MKKFTFQAVFLILITGAAFYIYMTNPFGSGQVFFPANPASKKMQIVDLKLNVEVADTQSKRKKGLGGRESMASDSGMLFVFPEIGKYPFWMKGLNFPLDFIWIREDKIVDLTQNALPPVTGQPDSALPIYQSKEDVSSVLEVPAGTINRSNIKVGDTVKII